ncbi:MAG TPA: hypothetical protein PLG59_12230 [bacterium]|mgnify:CR=1 FL=1|nr:hypothetical protein [bacterium]HQO35425.1 hypothetical protein [bacterium]HQP98753.1 hypothetical protein [bacterium]
MAIVERGVVQGPNIVFPRTLSLPEGTEVIVHIEPVISAPSKEARFDEADFMQQPCFGMWRDRPDMDDAVAWVRKDRDSWNHRLTGGV